MALNIKGALEILKRAGLDNDDMINASKAARHGVDALTDQEEQIRLALGEEYLDGARELIDRHGNPQKLSVDDLLNIDEL